MSSVLQVADSESDDSDSSEEEFFEVFFSVFEPLGSQQGHRKRNRKTYRRDITRTANNCSFYEIYLRSPTRYSDPVNLKQFRNRFLFWMRGAHHSTVRKGHELFTDFRNLW